MDTLRKVLFWLGVALLIVAAFAVNHNAHVDWNVLLCLGLASLALSRAPA